MDQHQPSGDDIRSAWDALAGLDMSSIEPMTSASARLLRPGGRFVFSTLHPAFNSGDAVPTAEHVTRDDGQFLKRYSVKVSGYG